MNLRWRLIITNDSPICYTTICGTNAFNTVNVFQDRLSENVGNGMLGKMLHPDMIAAHNDCCRCVGSHRKQQDAEII